jgi:thioredoxin-like negative regulator of GroEL
MTARARRILQILVVAIGLSGSGAAGVAWAGEEDDLQREIDTQKTGVADLERLDDLRATSDEIVLLKAWLDEAWSLRSKHEYDQVRQVLDRTLKQAELIRAKITLSKLQAQVQKREAALAELRGKIARTKKTLSDTMTKKKVLEGSQQQ